MFKVRRFFNLLTVDEIIDVAKKEETLFTECHERTLGSDIPCISLRYKENNGSFAYSASLGENGFEPFEFHQDPVLFTILLLKYEKYMRSRGEYTLKVDFNYCSIMSWTMQSQLGVVRAMGYNVVDGGNRYVKKIFPQNKG